MGSLNKPGFGGEGFLDLPQQPNIEVGDFVDFHQGETVSDHPNKTGDSAKEQKATDPSQNPGMILVAKICNALVKVGYDVTNVRKVAKLVTDNMMTASPTQVRPVDDPSLVENSDSLKSELLDEPARAVGLLLQGLLDRKTSRSRSRTVQMNSNEPVVLINQSSRLDRNTFSRVVDETVSQLQHQ
ncbi:hypothetical protein HRR87_006861 [Exophiala dermatitidis]|nr:hypothetical protein HRR87_006861 [Exophiala dermatitidis]